MTESLDPAALGTEIRRRRLALGLSVYRLAARSGVTYPYLRRIEAGEVGRLGLDVALAIAGALGVSLGLLLGESQGVGTLSGELADVVQGLEPAEMHALVRIAHVLREMRLQREAESQEALLDEPIAAYDREFPVTPLTSETLEPHE